MDSSMIGAVTPAYGLLGWRKVVGRIPRSSLELGDRLKEGIPKQSVLILKRHAQLTNEDIARLLGVSPRTVQRYGNSPADVLSRGESEGAWRIALVVAAAESVFEDRARALAWLRRPQHGLGMRVPFKVCETDVGAREVLALLGRIEHGVIG